MSLKDGEFSDLHVQLAECRAENELLRVRVYYNLDVERLIVEVQAKIATLIAEKKCLLTALEVLELTSGA